jgi:hypothetical protein
MSVPRWWLCLALALPAGCMSLPTGAPPAPTPPTSAQAGATTVVAVAPPAQTPPNIWQCLGLDVVCQDLGVKGQHLMNFLAGYFPALQPTPPVLPINDPANLKSDNPAVKAAAEVKGEEDAAPQKVQAINYLAKVGCGCYPDVQDALLAGLDDCTEVVRFETAKALRWAAGHPCTVCKSSSCCGPKVLAALHRIAYEMDDKACYVEPSARVRREARLALNDCGGQVPPQPIGEPEEAPLGPPPEAAPADQVATDEPVARDAVTIIPPRTRSDLIVRSQLRQAALTGDAAESSLQPASGLSPASVLDRSDDLLAKVNGEPIYAADVSRLVAERLRGVPGELTIEEQVALYGDVLQTVIDVRLLCRAAREGGYRSVAQASGAALELMLDPDTSARDVSVAREWLARRAAQAVQVTADDIRQRYERDDHRYRIAGAVRWEQLSLPGSAGESREAARQSIVGLRQRMLGVQSAAAADDIDRNRIEVRQVAWTEYSAIEPAELREVLLRLPVGALSPVFEDSSGFHMVRVLERRNERVQPLSEVAGQVHGELLRERQARAQAEYVQNLRTEAEVWSAVELSGARGLLGWEGAGVAGVGAVEQVGGEPVIPPERAPRSPRSALMHGE